MDPTIAGALIAGGAAVIGFGASAWQNASTVRSSRQAARDQRLWEKKSALYETLLDVAMHTRTSEDIPQVQEDVAALSRQMSQVWAYASNEVLGRFLKTLDTAKTLRAVVRLNADPDQAKRALDASQALDPSVTGLNLDVNLPLRDLNLRIEALRDAMRREMQEQPTILPTTTYTWRQSYSSRELRRWARMVTRSGPDAANRRYERREWRDQ
jgi:hypothetical protein